MQKRRKIISYILALIFTILFIIGLTFQVSNSFEFLINNIIVNFIIFLILLFIMQKVLNYLFIKLDNYIPRNNNKIINKLQLFNNKPFLFSIILILVCWGIYIIAFYPAILSPDPSFQILQFFGIDNKYSTYSILLDPNVLITNHHPVIHTLLLGFCLKFGLLFNNTNIGLFTYSIIQTIILAATLAYTIKFMKKININVKYRFICLLIYSLVPVFPFYALSPVKDVIFACLIILYIISIWNIINSKIKMTISNILKEIILLILIVLFRNNGIHVIVLSFPFLLLSIKENRKKLFCIFLIILSFYFSYKTIILPYYKITPTSIREVLSIPFQQTARYVKNYKYEVTPSEKEAIDKILFYKTLEERYDPEKADPVKNMFNRYSTTNDLKEYFVVWARQLTKHPVTYLEATLNNTYGYFYPLKTNWYIYYKFNKTINDHGFNYSYNNLNSLRTILSSFGLCYPYIPFLGLIVNIGLNTWLLLFMFTYLIYKKKYKNIVYLIPAFILLLVCIASPVNTYFRYALPNIFAMPTLLAIFIVGLKSEKLTNSKL